MNHVCITNWSDYALYTCNLSNLFIYTLIIKNYYNSNKRKYIAMFFMC